MTTSRCLAKIERPSLGVIRATMPNISTQAIGVETAQVDADRRMVSKIASSLECCPQRCHGGGHPTEGNDWDQNRPTRPVRRTVIGVS